jgi:hypothetical protein
VLVPPAPPDVLPPAVGEPPAPVAPPADVAPVDEAVPPAPVAPSEKLSSDEQALAVTVHAKHSSQTDTGFVGLLTQSPSL